MPAWVPWSALPRRSVLLISIGIGVLAWFTYYSSRELGIASADRDRAFAPADSVWTQAMLAELDVPRGWSPSNAAARVSTGVALGRRTAIRDLAAVVTAAAVVAFGAWLIAAGLEPIAVLIAMMALAVSSTFWWRGVTWSGDAMAPLLVLVAAWLLWRKVPTRRSIILAGTLTVLALLEDPSWLAVVPGAAWGLRRRVTPASERATITIIAAIAVVAAAWPPIDRWLIAGALSRDVLGGTTVPDPLTLWRLSMPGVNPPAYAEIRATLVAEFSTVGAILLIAGAAAALEPREQRAETAWTIGGLLGWLLLAPRSEFEHVSTALTVMGWAAAAVALTWIRRRTAPLFSTVAVALVGWMAVSAPTTARVQQAYPPNGRHDLERAAEAAYRLPIGQLPPDMAIVAETRRSNAELVRAGRREGRPITIIPQTDVTVVNAAAQAPAVAAFASARSNLERMGVLFEPRWLGSTAIGVVVGKTSCVELDRNRWQDVSLLTRSGALSIQGATAAARPGAIVVRFSGITGNPVARTEPVRHPYEFAPADESQILLRIPVRRWTPPTLLIRLAGAPTAAVAQAQDEVPTKLCAGVPPEGLAVGPGRAIRLISPNEPYFLSGWHLAEADPDWFRWTATERAALSIPVAPPGRIRVIVTAAPAARPALRPAIGLGVNACVLEQFAMQPGQGDYRWDVDAQCWIAGHNELWLRTSPLVSPGDGRDPRLLGARIGAIRLQRLDEAR